ncbi:hypothetical protein [Shewanella gaetbuli]|uniref:Uncharacterized protein n=1 Tax=Shewanella gaetbuli TaxID=220752 RepID=A0A9X1ZRW8_9GAMM|nr:hypothetical protein [Shewanella gaetbuli]MCL1142978.1 hypothetical protein [Shewanella gaetbuli]
MKFKNYRTKTIKACNAEGHALCFKSGEERELPEHLEVFAIESGLVPLDEVEMVEAREAEAKKAADAAKKAKAEKDKAAKKARSDALKKASTEAAQEEVLAKAAE